MLLSPIIEKAVFITDPDDLNRVTGEYSRLYFGNEFCEKRLPGLKELDTVLDFAGSRGLAFTLVTPYATNEGLRKIAALIDHAAQRTAFEIVINDWGVFGMAAAAGKKYRPVLGRLLTKQKRDPRIPGIAMPAASREYFESFNADDPALAGFLRENGIERIELDNVVQGIRRTGTLRASLYTPYVCVSTSRYCFVAGAEKGPHSLRTIPVSCARECREYAVKLRHRSMPKELLIRGTAYFYENARLPADLDALHVDRVVFQPAIPL